MNEIASPAPKSVIPVEATDLERIDAWHTAHLYRSIPADVIDMPYAEGAEHPSPLFVDDVVGVAERLRRRNDSHDAVWGVVADLRAVAAAEGRDPYADVVAQRLSAALVGAEPEIEDSEPQEWGHRHVDGTVTRVESRAAALEAAARYAPGFVELVHRARPEADWVRATVQPHTPRQRLNQLAKHIEKLRRISDWRGTRLAALGEDPNPPRDWRPIPGRSEGCTDPESQRAARQHEAAARMQDLTYEILGDPARGGAR